LLVKQEVHIYFLYSYTLSKVEGIDTMKS